VQENSANYKVGESIGDTGVGNSKSTNLQLNSGYTTTSEPTLTFIVSTSAVPLGILSIASTNTGTANFSVKNYTSNGYIVQTLGTPLKTGSYTMSTPSTAANSVAGTEQFGMNVVANTSPSTFGSLPVQVPSGTFSFGTAASNYNTTNKYAYNNGDTIAQSVKSSGETDYTISYIANAAPLTPSGVYSMNQTLVCTGTY
jgi:hypothetical protein